MGDKNGNKNQQEPGRRNRRPDGGISLCASSGGTLKRERDFSSIPMFFAVWKIRNIVRSILICWTAHSWPGILRAFSKQNIWNRCCRIKKLDILELRGTNENQQKILAKLRAAARLQNESDTEFQTRNLFSEIWLLLGKEIALFNYGERPVQTIRQERLVQMLAFIHHHYPKKLSLEEIAMATGFSSAAYYGKVFREACKMTPGAYRKENRRER